jgi:hypothetical protein
MLAGTYAFVSERKVASANRIELMNQFEHQIYSVAIAVGAEELA